MGPLGFILSFLLAWIINNLKCKGLFALAVYTPSIASGVAMTTIWSYFFSPDRYGLVNNILINMGIIVNPIIWNQDPATIMTVVILLSVWMGLKYDNTKKPMISHRLYLCCIVSRNRVN